MTTIFKDLTDVVKLYKSLTSNTEVGLTAIIERLVIVFTAANYRRGKIVKVETS